MPQSERTARCPSPTLATALVADLGFAAFVERNRPRYMRYAEARLPGDSACAAVSTTLASARKHWAWLLSQPCPAAEVWRELRLQVGRRADRIGPRDPSLLVLYGQLPVGCADSVVLCRWIGFGVDEAAELMGAEPPAVEVALAVARRTLPHFVDRDTSESTVAFPGLSAIG
ncbi:DNA-directed RNA polymerase specialized sigma24 family protein [Streptomyces sp. B1I3]|nr:DNA-directed RNA polymerase specialized sigma24 family protein [Streptomyces sp. B1I3]